MDIMIKVNNEVSKGKATLKNEEKVKQIPAPFCTLRKRLFFDSSAFESSAKGKN